MVFEYLNKRLLRTMALGGVVVVTSMFSSACEHGWDKKIRADQYTGSLYYNPREEHPITVSKSDLSMSIDVGRNDTRLAPYKLNELRTFLHYYRDQGTGRINVTLPTNSYYQGAVHQVLGDVQKQMEDMSLGAEVISVKRYSGRGDKYPTIHLSFQRHVAKGPDCDGWNENLNQSENNRNSHYWGCASQKNMAAMVANPRDLKGPRGWSPRDSRRRDMASDKWIKGEVSSATRSEDERVSAASNTK